MHIQEYVHAYLARRANSGMLISSGMKRDVLMNAKTSSARAKDADAVMPVRVEGKPIQLRQLNVHLLRARVQRDISKGRAWDLPFLRLHAAACWVVAEKERV